jgi:hypothetical protein
VVVIDEDDKRLYERRLQNDLCLTLKALAPFKDRLVSTVVESTFNWYWLRWLDRPCPSYGTGKPHSLCAIIFEAKILRRPARCVPAQAPKTFGYSADWLHLSTRTQGGAGYVATPFTAGETSIKATVQHSKSNLALKENTSKVGRHKTKTIRHSLP